MPEVDIIKKAIEDMKGGAFNCIPLSEYRSPEYEFEAATHDMVAAAGYTLEWKNTFQGGCWHLIS